MTRSKYHRVTYVPPRVRWRASVGVAKTRSYPAVRLHQNCRCGSTGDCLNTNSHVAPGRAPEQVKARTKHPARHKCSAAGTRHHPARGSPPSHRSPIRRRARAYRPEASGAGLEPDARGVRCYEMLSRQAQTLAQAAAGSAAESLRSPPPCAEARACAHVAVVACQDTATLNKTTAVNFRQKPNAQHGW